MRRRRTLGFGLALLVLGTRLSAQQPTLAATTEWLNGQFPQYLQYDLDGRSLTRAVYIKATNCTLTVTDASSTSSTEQSNMTSHVALKDLDAGHMAIEALGSQRSDGVLLVVNTANGRLAVTSNVRGQELRGKTLLLAIAELPLASRIQAALAHAIRLCGGGTDPF